MRFRVGIGDYQQYLQEQEQLRVDAVVAALLAGELQNYYWTNALTNPPAGAAGTLLSGRGRGFASYFDAPHFGTAKLNPAVSALLDRQVALYEQLAAAHPAVTVLPEGSNPPGGSGPQRPILLLNVRTGATRWMSGYSPAEVAARGGAGAGIVPAGSGVTTTENGATVTFNTPGGAVTVTNPGTVHEAVVVSGNGSSGGGSGTLPGGTAGSSSGFPMWAIAAAGVAAFILLSSRRR